MNVRGLELADCGVVRMKGEALAAVCYPELIPAIDREHAILEAARIDTRQYARVIGPVGAPVAALIAHSGDNVWASKQHASILLWYSEVHGGGIALLRDFRNWTGQQKRMVMAGFVDDFGMGERTSIMVQRVGFTKRGGAYMYFPRRSK